MSSKQRRPLDDPPSVGSSSEEVEESDEEVSEEEAEEPEQLPQSISKPAESEEEEDEETESEDEEVQAKKKKTENSSFKKKNPDPESSVEPGDTYSMKSSRALDFTIKPIAPLKTGDENTPLSKPAKRRPERSTDNGKSSKPKKAKPSIDKIKGEEEIGASGKAEKKSAISRLWSEEDEIAILKGLMEFQSKMGKDPIANQGEFHEFMKKYVHVDVSKTKLMDKVRRLKKKYINNTEKSTDGEDPILSKPHEYKSYQLSKKIWGNNSSKNLNSNAVDVHRTTNGSNDDRSSGKSAKKSRGSDKFACDVPVDTATETKDLENLKGEKVEPSKEKEENFSELYPFVMNAFSSDHMSESLSGLDVVKWNLRSVGKLELKKFDSEWKKLNMAEAEITLRKIDLIREQARMVLDAMQSSKP